VIQAAMGWADYHLHVFSDGQTEYGRPDPELAFRDERRATLGDLILREGGGARYTYDFGDDWEHEIVVEKVLAAEPGVPYPGCVAGAGACPPEDCGGVWGYEHLREVLATPTTTSTTRWWRGWGWTRQPTSIPTGSTWTRPTGRSPLWAPHGEVPLVRELTELTTWRRCAGATW